MRVSKRRDDGRAHAGQRQHDEEGEERMCGAVHGEGVTEREASAGEGMQVCRPRVGRM